MQGDGPGGQTWCLVLPVKRLADAKTRLGPVAGPLRAELALAFALDTAAAALAAADVVAVVAVTDEPEATRALTAAGVQVVPDKPDAGLNPALAHGARVAASGHPGSGVGALSADLPALRPAALSTALAAGARHRSSFVRDRSGSGTTLLLARDPADLAPAFGAGSASAHRAAGATELVGRDAPDSLRQDVDTPDDLRTAAGLGLGRHSAVVVARLAAAGRFGAVQATVRGFDPQTRSGSVLLDDGTELTYDGQAFAAGGVRLLRLGQRVRIEVSGAGTERRVTFVTVATLADPR